MEKKFSDSIHNRPANFPKFNNSNFVLTNKNLNVSNPLQQSLVEKILKFKHS